jgi:serine phosphatase RsbU (regulator of sigma subunit)
VYEGINYPVGGWQLEKNRIFPEQQLKVEKNDMIYIGSDGFQTQFGGAHNKKYGSVRLHNLLSQISIHNTRQQKQLLMQELLDWKSGTIQTDDVLVLGIKF